MIKKCADEGRKPQVAEFGEKLDDSSFFNQLQNGVNRWIREIQKVNTAERSWWMFNGHTYFAIGYLGIF